MSRLHPDEVEVPLDLVRRLVVSQCPAWSELLLVPVAEHGTDHRLFRLGDDLVVRMPVYAASAPEAAVAARWLPVLAPLLPVAVPVPLFVGEPDLGYPFAWSVVAWLPGSPPLSPGPTLAADLAAFVLALHAVDPVGGPAKTGTSRGTRLRGWDPAVRAAVAESGSRVDGAAVLAVWEDCVAAPEWAGPPVWIHGDLLAGNLLAVDDRLVGVIDFGALGVADPAPDLMPYWSTLSPAAAPSFRDAVRYDDDTWRRARGWALGPALTGIPYYWDTAPNFARRGLASVARVLAEVRA